MTRRTARDDAAVPSLLDDRHGFDCKLRMSTTDAEGGLGLPDSNHRSQVEGVARSKPANGWL